MKTQTLQGMSDGQYFEILAEVAEIQFLIVEAGGMATKTAVEEVLMKRHGLDRSDAHTFVNVAAAGRDFMVRRGGVEWLADRPAPVVEKYPEIGRV